MASEIYTDEFLATHKVASVDYETFYDEVYSLTQMSYWHYCHDPRFDAYRVSIVADDFEWVGYPKDAPWERIKGYVWTSHNAPFDRTVHQRLQEDGIVPSWLPPYWGNTENLCAWLRVPRSLAKASKVLFGATLKKKVRSDAKGKTWKDFSPEEQARMDEYALEDSRWCRRIWVEYVGQWSHKERRAADLIDARCLRGVCIDRDGCEKDMQVIRRVIWDAEQRIPWRDTGVMLSPQHLAQACRDAGIEPPPSLDMKDEECAAWEDKYGERFPWVGAMRDWRRMNALLQKYEIIVERIKPDGRAEYTIRYMGAITTGRTAAGEDKDGDQKGRRTFNMLNLPRAPFYVRKVEAGYLTVAYEKKDLKQIEDFIKKHDGALPPDIVYAADLRKKIIPGPGMKFVICDMAQIEARVTNWLCRDKRVLDLVRKGFSVYEVHAMNLLGWAPPSPPVLGKDGKPLGLKKLDPGLYALAKARELALGFEAGHIKFIIMAPQYISDEECEAIFGKAITEAQEEWYLGWLKKTRQNHLVEEYKTLPREKQVARVNSQLQVSDFRLKKKHLVDLWHKMGEEFRRSVGGTHEVELPSRRLLTYFDVCLEGTGRSSQLKARVVRGGPFKYFYSGKIFQNSVQATARDIFIEGQLRLDDEGVNTVLDVYDENLTEVPIDFPAKRVAEIMTMNPEWAKTLPLGAEVEESMYYKK